jgi:hypothetical protein
MDDRRYGLPLSSVCTIFISKERRRTCRREEKVVGSTGGLVRGHVFVVGQCFSLRLAYPARVTAF